MSKGIDDRKSRSDIAWEMAKEYAKHQAELMWPNEDRRKKEEPKLARAEYQRLMYP